MKYLDVIAIAATLCLGCWASPPPTVSPPEGPFLQIIRGTGDHEHLVWLPGLSMSRTAWGDLPEAICAERVCHFVEVAGFAGNPPRGALDLDLIAEELEAFLSAERIERVVLVGHSFGGFLALRQAVTRPERIAAVVSIDGVPFLPGLFDREQRAETARPYAEALRSFTLAQTPEQVVENNRQVIERSVRAGPWRSILSQDANQANLEAVASAAYLATTTDLREELEKLEVPTLVFASTAFAESDEQRTTAEASYHAQFSRLRSHQILFSAEALHFIHLDAPEWVALALEEFLEEIGY